MKTGRMAGAHEHIDHDPGAMLPTKIVTMDGIDYLFAHADGITTGVVVDSGVPDSDGRLIVSLWREPDEDDGAGTALGYTLGADQLDLVIASLTRMRDQRAGAAADQATAALARAAGR